MSKPFNVTLLLMVAAFILGGAIVYLFWNPTPPINDLKNSKKSQNLPTTFEECVAQGYPVMESYPRQCKTDNKTFVEDIGNELEKSDLITIQNPRPNQTITSPLTIQGEARGQWFFEAQFRVFLYDAEGRLIAQSLADAQGEWMTENFVPFVSTLTFESPSNDIGRLILEKNNPSGLPENDDALVIPVKFR